MPNSSERSTTPEGMAPEHGTMEEFAEMCELARKVALATSNGDAVGHIASFRKKVREAAFEAAKRKSIPRGKHVLVSEHHNQEVRKHFEYLVKKYAGADFCNTNTEAGPIWNDAVNLAEGILKERSTPLSESGLRLTLIEFMRLYEDGKLGTDKEVMDAYNEAVRAI